MGESRQELLAWVNSLLQLNITKVEQMGTGAALCQIYDSIWGDVEMNRVKFNVNSEYLYLENFKILQKALSRHQFPRTIDVQALAKCKMQDNLDFLQYTKRFWDQNYPGGEYDALARRKGPVSGGPRSAASTAPRTGSSAGARRTPTAGAPRVGVGARAGGGAANAALTQENEQLKETVQGLERERDFYFSKLRDIELLIQQAIDDNPELEKDENGMLKAIQEILYSTEEGFEIPPEGEEGVVAEEETF